MMVFRSFITNKVKDKLKIGGEGAGGAGRNITDIRTLAQS